MSTASSWVESIYQKIESIKVVLTMNGLPGVYALFQGIDWLAVLSGIGILAGIVLGIRRDRRERRKERREYLATVASLRGSNKREQSK